MYPRNVGRLCTKTQYLLGELGVLGWCENSEIQGYAKRSKGNIELSPLGTKPSPIV